MGRLSHVSSLNTEALAWEKEEDVTQVGKAAETEGSPPKQSMPPLPLAFRALPDVCQGLKPLVFFQRISQA